MAYFGTFSQLVVFADFSRSGALEKWERCWNETRALLAALETRFSTEIPEGDIGSFNALKAGGSVIVDSETAELFRLAKEMHAFSGGAFNPAVYLLADLWGFSPRFMRPAAERPLMPYDRAGGPASALPDEKYIEAFTRLADFSRCVLTSDGEGRFVLSKTGPDEIIDGQSYSVKLDFGAIAKGYAAERVAELLSRYGYRYGLVNIGSSSFRLLEYYSGRAASLAGDQGADLWPVNIRSPFDPSESYLSAYGKNEGVSTSGSYDRFYTVDRVRYSHIIDGKSGRPAGGEILSATIVGGDAAWNDALSTALCVMSAEEARRFTDERLKDRQVLLILADGSLISNTERYRLNSR
jgi:thiamine biosynthesis lipoprotein